MGMVKWLFGYVDLLKPLSNNFCLLLSPFPGPFLIGNGRSLETLILSKLEARCRLYTAWCPMSNVERPHLDNKHRIILGRRKALFL